MSHDLFYDIFRADNTVDLELSSGKENNSKAKKGRRKQFDEDGM